MRFPFRLILLLVLFAEIAGLVLVGQAIGVAGTLGLVLLGMVAGMVLLRRQGIATLLKIRSEMAAGRAPARPLFQGAVLALAALLLIVPGFLTDIAGLLLFIPATRAALWRRISARVNLAAFRRRNRTAASGVIDLEPGEYATSQERKSPWRRGIDEA